MALLRDTTTYGVKERYDNGTLTSSFPRIQNQKLIWGSGVQKRVGFKQMKAPQRSAPVAYWKQWEYMSCGLFVEQTVHTRDWWFGQHDETSSLDRYPNYNTSLNQDEFDPCADEAERRATGKLLEALKGEGANIANMFGERQQTVKSIAGVLDTVVQTIRDLRRGRLQSAVRRMGGDPLSARKLRGKDIANQWLSLQYGWKPLFSDVYDLIEGAHKREKTRLMVFRKSASAKSNYRVPFEKTPEGSWKYPYNANTKKEDTGVYLVQCVKKYMVRAYPDIVLAEPAALGVTNPLTVAWEVTPWSFVVDWFLPIGAYLEQLSADHGWHFHDGCLSAITKSNVAWQWNYATSSSSTTGSLGYQNVDNDSFNASSYGDFKCITFRRNTIGAFPSARLPRLKNPVSTGHFLNGLALLTQLVSGGPVRKR